MNDTRESIEDSDIEGVIVKFTHGLEGAFFVAYRVSEKSYTFPKLYVYGGGATYTKEELLELERTGSIGYLRFVTAKELSAMYAPFNGININAGELTEATSLHLLDMILSTLKEDKEDDG